MAFMKKMLKDYFATKPYAFVVLFGSYANGSASAMSDVDIGVFCTGEIDYLALGYESAQLETLLHKRIDIVALNGIAAKEPRFAFELLKNHEPLAVHDEEAYIAFKTAVQLNYLDHLPLFLLQDEALKKRLDTGTFGEAYRA